MFRLFVGHGTLCVCLCTILFAQNGNKRKIISFQSNKVQSAYFRVQFDDLLDKDSLTLSLYEHTLINNFGSVSLSQPTSISKAGNKGGFYQFVTSPINGPCYMTLGYGLDASSPIIKTRFDLLNLYLVEPGDSIKITITKDSTYGKIINKKGFKINDAYFNYIYKNDAYTIHFSGTGSAKYECRYKADRFASAYDNISGSVLDNYGNALNDVYMDHQKNESIEILIDYKNSISSLAFEIISTDFLGKYNGDWFRLFGSKWYDWHHGYATKDKDSLFFKNAITAFNNRINQGSVTMPYTGKKFSAWYPYWIIKKEVAVASVKNANASARDNVVYEKIKRSFNSEVRDRILTDYLMDWYIYLDNGENILKDALSTISSVYYKKQIQELVNQQTKGKPAYNFSLFDTKGNLVRLHDFSGKVVFIDFWYTACSNCISYYKSVLSDVEEEYKDNPSINFISINIDLDKLSWLKSVKSGNYTSNHAINLFTNGLGAEHDVIKRYNITDYPRPLLIDKEGKIFSASAADLRNKERLKGLIEEALKQ